MGRISNPFSGKLLAKYQIVAARIAEAVHEAVGELTDGDLAGKCLPFAAAAYTVVGTYLPGIWRFQAGSWGVLADPPNGWCVMDMGIDVGSFHCWLSCAPGEGDRFRREDVFVFDPSAKFFRDYCENILQVKSIETIHADADGHTVALTMPRQEDHLVWTRGDIGTEYLFRATRRDVYYKSSEHAMKVCADIFQEGIQELRGLNHRVREILTTGGIQPLR